MRILLLNYEYPPLGGGAGNATYFILNELARHSDLAVDLITASTSKSRVEPLSESIAIHYLDIGKSGHIHYQTNRELLTYSSRCYLYARKRIRRNRYDGIHAFFGIPCGFIAMKLGLPYIVSLRGSDVPGYSERYALLDKWVFRDLSRKVWKGAQAVVANSKGLRDLALQTARSGQIRVVPNGVDTAVFCPAPQKPGAQNIRLISTGRLIPRKGYHHLIRALADQSHFHLTLVGDGNQRDELKSLARSLKVPVTFTGRKSKEAVVSLLQNADVFVLPSTNEGMSNSLLEAMACGLPVLVTDAPGSEELVTGNGRIVKRGSVSALRDGLKWFQHNRNQIHTMGEVSRHAALKMSWARVASTYIDLYRQLDAQSNPSRQERLPGI